MKPGYLTISALALLWLGTTALPAVAAPRVTAAQARGVVLHRFPHSRIVGDIKYEHEDGAWQYAVLVRSKGVLREVLVDASSGRISSVEVTNAAEEAREARADAAHVNSPGNRHR